MRSEQEVSQVGWAVGASCGFEVQRREVRGEVQKDCIVFTGDEMELCLPKQKAAAEATRVQRIEFEAQKLKPALAREDHMTLNFHL